VDFEWDPKKAAENEYKHDVSFREAATVFHDPLGITVSDPDHSFTELRFLTVGLSERNRVLIVSYTERHRRLRIISARLLTRKERKAYETIRQKRD